MNTLSGIITESFGWQQIHVVSRDRFNRMHPMDAVRLYEAIRVKANACDYDNATIGFYMVEDSGGNLMKVSATVEFTRNQLSAFGVFTGTRSISGGNTTSFNFESLEHEAFKRLNRNIKFFNEHKQPV